MDFEYDEAKSQLNQSKHGINFDEAQLLWNDVLRIEIKALFTSEPRFMIIGKINNKHWCAIITYRDQVVRIISVRRARKNEVILYESRRIR